MTEPATPARKTRRDAFDGERRRKFLDALKRGASLRDAARKAGVSHQTVYNHQAADPAFARQCELALDMAGTDVELHAWERGVAGIKEPVFDRAGEIVGYRLKRSDNILRLLLQGSMRNKYGPNPGFTRKRLHKLERKRIEQEVRTELHEIATSEHADAALNRLLDGVDRKLKAERAAQGWTQDQDGHMIPPGWVRAPDWAALANPDGRGEFGVDPV